MESLEYVGAVLGGSVAIAVAGLVFAVYKLGLLYQLFHKVRCHNSTVSLQVELSVSFSGNKHFVIKWH